MSASVIDGVQGAYYFEIAALLALGGCLPDDGRMARCVCHTLCDQLMRKMIEMIGQVFASHLWVILR